MRRQRQQHDPTIVTFLDRTNLVDGSREALTLVLLTIGMRRQQQLHDIEGGINYIE